MCRCPSRNLPLQHRASVTRFGDDPRILSLSLTQKYLLRSPIILTPTLPGPDSPAQSGDARLGKRPHPRHPRQWPHRSKKSKISTKSQTTSIRPLAMQRTMLPRSQPPRIRNRHPVAVPSRRSSAVPPLQTPHHLPLSQTPALRIPALRPSQAPTCPETAGFYRALSPDRLQRLLCPVSDSSVVVTSPSPMSTRILRRPWRRQKQMEMTLRSPLRATNLLHQQVLVPASVVIQPLDQTVN